MTDQKAISLESGGIAAFTIIQILLEKLVEREVLNKDDVRGVLGQSIHLNEPPPQNLWVRRPGFKI